MSLFRHSWRIYDSMNLLTDPEEMPARPSIGAAQSDPAWGRALLLVDDEDDRARKIEDEKRAGIMAAIRAREESMKGVGVLAEAKAKVSQMTMHQKRRLEMARFERQKREREIVREHLEQVAAPSPMI